MNRTILKLFALGALAACAGWAQVTTNCSPASLPEVIGVVVSVTCAPTGGVPPYTWSIGTGTLPPGLSQDPSSGQIQGTLQDPAGPYSFTVVATDSTPVLHLTGTQSYSGTTVDALTVSCTLATGPLEVGVLYTNTCTAGGGTPPYAWSVSGQIVPPGLTVSSTGTISYTPTAPLVAYQYRVLATDSSNPILTKGQAFTGAIAPAVAITTTSPLPAATAGTLYSQQFAATGGLTPYVWGATGLPTWLTMSTTGLLSGIPPSSGTVGPFTVTVTDSVGGTGASQFTFSVGAALTITTPLTLPPATIGVSYSETFAATGGSGTGYTWAVTGQPSWLSMSTAGVLTGTPPTGATTSSFKVTVTDSNSNSTSGTFTLPITLAISTSSPLPAATVGLLYNQTLAAAGGLPPYTWSATGLPAGLSLTPAGVITGTPTAAAVDGTVKVTVTDSAGITATATLSLPVTLVITTAPTLPAATVNTQYSVTFAAVGGQPPYTWSATGLPSWATLSAAGVLTGKPVTAGPVNFSVTVTDSLGVSSSPVAFTLQVNPPGLAITTATPLPNATVGVGYSQTLAATGGTPPYKWSITAGSLPAPLTLNPTTGAITGTPTAPVTASFTVTVSDSAGTTPASKAFTLTVVAAPVITTATLPSGTVGVAYSQTLAATGGTAPYSWAVTAGGLPGGLSLSTSGVISGTPSAAGTFSFTVTLTDADGVTATKALTLTVISGLTITTPSPLPTGEVNVVYSETLAASGGVAPYSWIVTAGALPPGLTLLSAGAIIGTPSTAGTYSFTVQASDSSHLTTSAAFTLTIASALIISTPSTLNGGSQGASYTQTLAASGGVSPYTWAVSGGALPPGLSLSTGGVITGIPTATGTFVVTIKVTDTLAATASRQFTIVIASGLTIATPPVLPPASLGLAYSYALQVSGGTAPFTWSVTSGAPPAGVTLKPDGTLTGVPTAAGTFTFTVQVLDSAGHQASEQLSLAVTPVLSITTTSLAGGAVGTAYSQTLAATGGTPPYTWTLQSGALPAGLSLSAAGAITGTPSTAGTFSFTVQVTDSAAATAVKQLSIVVSGGSGGLTIVTAGTLPNAAINASYAQTLSATGGTPPYTWALTAGALPTGLALSTSGVVSGTPTVNGSFQLTATVTDSAATPASAAKQFTLVVGGRLTISTATLPGGTVGGTYSQTLAATGGTPPYTFSVSAGSPPPGITLSGAVLSGTPTAAGSYTFTIEVTDSVSATATQQFTVVIGQLGITTTVLPAAAVGTAYSQTLAASGAAPYTWTVTKGSLPDGLTLDASSGTISGTPTTAGSSSVTVQVTDSTKATASATFALTVIAASFTGAPGTATSAQQVSFSLTPGAAYAQDIAGQVVLAFAPDSSLGAPADDPAIQFAGGGTSASFTIPAGSTAALPFSLQTGTVAGTITLTVSWQAGGATLAVPAALTETIKIAPAAPVISGVTVSTTSSGFQVAVTGYSNTREMSQAVVTFTPASGQTLQTTTLTVSVSSASAAWFGGSASDAYGSQFILTLPFTVSNGSARAIASVSVQLVNSQGTSPGVSGTL